MPGEIREPFLTRRVLETVAENYDGDYSGLLDPSSLSLTSWSFDQSQTFSQVFLRQSIVARLNGLLSRQNQLAPRVLDVEASEFQVPSDANANNGRQE